VAIVRELVTVLGTEFDSSGLKQYEAGMGRVKEMALGLAGAMGIAFSAEKIFEFADGLIETGKEVNRLVAQLRVLARPFDDVDEAQQRVLDSAQTLGLRYKDVLETYREFFGVMRDSKVSQEELLTTTENIYKALRVGRASAEEMTNTMELLRRAFARGGFRAMTIGRLEQQAPVVLEGLMKHFGVTSMDQLRAIAKEGKITAEAFVATFGKANEELDAQFAKVPQKLGNVFNKIYNDLVNVTAQIYKLTAASEFMGTIVWAVWSRFTAIVKETVNYLGGLKQTVELISIAIGVVMTRAILTATAATIRFAIANAAALAPWLAIGAAVAAVAFGIQDLMYWIQNKHSNIGTWVGPFEKLAENFKKLDIFAGFRGIKDLFTGDFSGFVKEFHTVMESSQAEIALLVVAIGTIGTAFFLLYPAVRGLIALIRGITPAASEAAAGVEAAAGKTAAGKTLTGGAKSGPRVSGAKIADAAQVALTGITLAQDAGLINTGVDSSRLNDALLGSLLGTPFGPAGKVAGGIGGFLWKRPEALPDWLDLTPMELYRQFTDRPGQSKELYPQQPAFTPGGAWGTQQPGFTPGGAWAPTIPPGAMGPTPPPPGPVTNNVQPVFNQTNNVHVETILDADQIGRAVGDKIGQLTGDRFSAFSRDITVAAPRIEAATQ
jgi:tape measure domain-containing protein